MKERHQQPKKFLHDNNNINSIRKSWLKRNKFFIYFIFKRNFLTKVVQMGIIKTVGTNALRDLRDKTIKYLVLCVARYN